MGLPRVVHYSRRNLPDVYPTLGSAGCTELTSPVHGNARKSFGEDNLEGNLIFLETVDIEKRLVGLYGEHEATLGATCAYDSRAVFGCTSLLKRSKRRAS